MTLLPLFSRTNVFCFAVLWLTAFIGLYLVPVDVMVPIVWNPFDGKPFIFGPGWLGVLVFPVFGLLGLIIISLSSLSSAKKDFESGRNVFNAFISGILCMFFVLECTFIFIGRGGVVYYPKIAALVFAGLLVIVGNMLPKSQPSSLVGIALPRAIRDPNNWRITHRWTGRISIITGISLFVLVLTVLDGPEIFMGVFTAAVVPILSGVTLSYFVSKTLN